MDAHFGTFPAQYHLTNQWYKREDEPWADMLPQALPIRQEVNPMQRYLHEQDKPWFTPRAHADVSLDTIYLPDYTTPSAYCYRDPTQFSHPAPPRCASPSLSGFSPPSTYNSWSDRRSISWSPPSTPQYTPEVIHHDSFGVPFGGYTGIKQEQPRAGECVALNEIQTYADALPDEDTFEVEPSSYYAGNVQEGYQPMPLDRGHYNGSYAHDDEVIHVAVGGRRPDGPRFRRRQAPESRQAASTGSRVSKRTTTRKRTTTTSSQPDNCNGHTTPSNRAFPCPFALYGCPSGFGSKNEWKRHINTQHMRLNFWRCDLCDQTNRKPNDFNRKDLFIQHVRRMHPPSKTPGSAKPAKSKSGLNIRPSKHDPYEQELVAIAHRCSQNSRPSPELSGCLFCDDKFAGPGSWDDRLEHIGKHMELSKKGTDGVEVPSSSSAPVPLNPRYWRPDPELEEWLKEEEVIVHDGEVYVLAEDVGA